MNLEAEAEAQTIEERCSLTCPSKLAQFLLQWDHLSQIGTSHINQEMCQFLPINDMAGFSQPRFPLPR